ncbi:MAG: hypothetical protein J6I35_03335 [Ruminobacter sp.]|uniref:hypothetical protein n=1 Tax=Ruminobacter sp. TaxID=2774296 RepID=UPI001B4FF23D|nr:hypothetical protein [Ruminobacter sp.]MBP3748579.1 hypothetical protein [Ruminobacter sp.]
MRNLLCFGRSMMMLSIMAATAGCDRRDNVVCESSRVQESLRSEFSYELQQHSDLPQIMFKNIELKSKMNSLVWCGCNSEISGKGDLIVDALITKFGAKKWQVHRTVLDNTDFGRMSPRDLSRSKSVIALYLLNKYKNSLSEKSYTLRVDVNYNIDVTGNIIRNVDYHDDVNIAFLSVVAADIPPYNPLDQYVITKILNSQSVE